MTVGPDHKVPDDAVVKSSAANGPFAGTDSDAVSIGDVPNDWWRLYDDPRIDELVQQALVANTDLRVAAQPEALDRRVSRGGSRESAGNEVPGQCGARPDRWRTAAARREDSGDELRRHWSQCFVPD
jgi:hypothetical protein